MTILVSWSIFFFLKSECPQSHSASRAIGPSGHLPKTSEVNHLPHYFDYLHFWGLLTSLCILPSGMFTKTAHHHSQNETCSHIPMQANSAQFLWVRYSNAFSVWFQRVRYRDNSQLISWSQLQLCWSVLSPCWRWACIQDEPSTTRQTQTDAPLLHPKFLLNPEMHHIYIFLTKVTHQTPHL